MEKKGYFGGFGGQFVPETLMPALEELEEACRDYLAEDEFQQELLLNLRDYCGRPTPLYYAAGLTEAWQGARVYLKREDLNHTGAHKINNTMGQIFLATRMGKERIIAETGAGQHGVATATVAARFGLDCQIYMGSEDIKRQALNVYRMRLLGAEVIPVEEGTKTLKDATNAAIRDWVTNVEHTHYIIGSVVGPHPYPTMVRDFQKIIGEEAREQILKEENRLPGALIACVGGGSNAIGLFYPFLEDKGVQIFGVEAAGLGLESGQHAASISKGERGILHGALSYLLQDEEGQISPAHSISAGLDYPGVGPEHSHLADTKRAEYVSVTDQEALDTFEEVSRLEGIIPALESAHALAFAARKAGEMEADEIIIVNLSGRGDKDVSIIKEEAE